MVASEGVFVVEEGQEEIDCQAQQVLWINQDATGAISPYRWCMIFFSAWCDVRRDVY